ncbi:MAG: class I SAM-dependent RNA methyltransferase [Gemmatimonadota bacterium]
MTEIATLRIDSIAAGGAGTGRLDGLAVFMHRTAPGDLVRAEIRRKGRFATGKLLEVMEPSRERVEPGCPHYLKDNCGGCQLQHIGYDHQLRAKQRIVGDALRRIGGSAAIADEVKPAPQPWRYRNKLTLTMRPRRSREARTGAKSGWVIGMRPIDDPSALFHVHDCPITNELVMESWSEVRGASQLLPEAASLRGVVRSGSRGRTLELEGGRSWDAAADFADACPSIKAIVWRNDQGIRTLVRETRPDSSEATWSFEQVNPPVASLLDDYVVETVLAARPRTAIDAYSGRGKTSGRLAKAGIAVTAVELDGDAVRAAVAALPDARVVQARVEDVIGDLLPVDLVILNPPRTGVDSRVTAALERAQPRPSLVVYVSCDAATLARDIARLPSWRVREVRPYDMFPQTAHVETVCVLEPRS